MDGKKIIILIGALIVVGGAVFLAKTKKTPVGKSKVVSHNKMTLQERLDADAELLDDFSGEQAEESRYPVYEAVLRLSRGRHKNAMKAALKMVDSEDKLWRQAAAQALGAYDNEEALEALGQLIEDEDPIVKRAALQNLGKAKTQSRTEYIKSLLEKESFSTLDKIDLYMSYYISTTEEKPRSWARGRLLQLAKSSNKNTAAQATQRLIQVSGHHDSVLKLLEGKIKSSSDERVVANSVRLLSGKKKDLVKKYLKPMLKHKSDLVRKTTLQAIKNVCPENRWSLLASVRESEKNKSVQQVLVREVAALSEKSSEPFLKEMLANDKEGVLKEHIEKALIQLQSGNKSPCS